MKRYELGVLLTETFYTGKNNEILQFFTEFS